MALRVEATSNFIVRLSTETRSTKRKATVIWRGVVEHAQSGKLQAFEDLDETFEFIRKQMHPETEGGIHEDER